MLNTFLLIYLFVNILNIYLYFKNNISNTIFILISIASYKLINNSNKYNSHYDVGKAYIKKYSDDIFLKGNYPGNLSYNDKIKIVFDKMKIHMDKLNITNWSDHNNIAKLLLLD